MHPTIPRRAGRGWAFLALFAVLLMLALALAAPAFAAKTPFDGGPIVADTATYAANDHTVYAMRFSAEAGGPNALAPDTQYYVKVRFTPNADGTPASTDNRGFVWNGATGKWVQEAAGVWMDFPVVTTESDGAITQSPWIYYKFGDTTKTGQYYLIVSLSVGVAGTTKNGTSWIPVTVFDPGTAGGWVHPGVDDSANAGKTGKVVDFATSSSLIALQRIEGNACDDDNDGVVDDEQYGPVQDGSFDLAVPTGRQLQAQVGGSKAADWPDSTGFEITVPDTDIALGADDMAAPTAPTALTAETVGDHVALSWDAATDDTGVTAYDVYRWIDPEAGSGYTAAPVRIAGVTDGTTYDDVDVTGGGAYHYLVRAVDEATNVGPRSNVATNNTMIAFAAQPRIVNWGQAWKLTAELRTAAGGAVPDAAVRLRMSLDGGANWADVGAPLTPDAGTSTYGVNIAAPKQKAKYRLEYAGDAGAKLAAAQSLAITVTPRVKLGRVVAPKSVKKGRAFKAYGSLVPRHKSGSRSVRIKCYQKVSGKWRLRKTVRAINRDYRSYSRYSANLKLTSRGAWRLVARYDSTSKYAAKTASARYVRAR